MKTMKATRRLVSGPDDVVSIDEVASIEARIARLRQEGASAIVEAKRLEAAKLTALDFESSEQFDRDIAKQRWFVDRAAKLLPELEKQLASAKAVWQRAALARHRHATAALYPKLKRAIEAAAAVQSEVTAARQAAIAELGEGMVAGNIPHLLYRGLLMPDFVEVWEKEQDRVWSTVWTAPPLPPTATPRLLPAPTSAAKPAAAEAAPPPVSKPAAAKAAPPPEPKPRPEPRQDRAPAEGEAKVFFIRAGHELPDGTIARSGDQYTLPADQARHLVENGVAEFVQAEIQ